MLLVARALVVEDDSQPPRQERGLAQALYEGLGRPLDLLEDVPVGKKGDGRAGVLGDALLLQVGGGVSAGELLAEDLAVAVHLDRQPLRKAQDLP